jgi:formamidopyrimidine-DNA glycosylase
MPELPEVETVCRDLRERLLGSCVSRVEVRFPDIVETGGLPPGPLLEGRTISSVSRRGKCALVGYDGDIHLVFHLGMTGRLAVESAAAPLAKHTHLVLSFHGNPYQLRFQDPRRFGFVRIHRGEHARTDPFVARLGPEPLDLHRAEFQRLIAGRKRMLKPLLLDQSFVAGLGNIYVDESLYLAGLHPRRNSGTLHRKDSERLLRSVKRVLRDAIRSGGTTLRDYRRPSGGTGRFQRRLRVYGREGKPCRRCRTPIEKVWFHGRGTHYCPRCQT